jgi:hypothetical protein
MKKILIVGMLFAASISMANLISNPGFETGDTSDWGWWKSTDGPTGTVVTTLSQEGTYSFETSYGSPAGGEYSYLNQSTSMGELDGDKEINLSFQYNIVNGDPANQGMYARMLWWDDTDSYQGFLISGPTVRETTTGWEEYTLSVDAPSNIGRVRMDVVFDQDPSAFVYVDNFSLTQVPEPTTASIAVIGAFLVAARLRRRKD